MLDRLISASPRVATVHAQRGALLVALGRPDDALAAARASLELDPSSLPVRSFLAELLSRTNHEPEAEAERATIARLKGAVAPPRRTDVEAPAALP
jgi:predicted Zn-dependent protease